MKKEIEVKKNEIIHITIKIGDKEHKLTLEEAQNLLRELDKAIGEKYVWWTQPTVVPQPIYVPAPQPYTPWWGTPMCGIGGHVTSMIGGLTS